MIPIALEVNGRRVQHEVAARTHLADFIREQVGLTGTHLGCEHGVCGACVVLLDGQPVRACITFAVACDGHAVTTIEGHDGDPVMARLRAAFTAHHALQCGYCTPGMLATARDIVLRLPEADEGRIRAELSGNLCRCTGYQGIVNAVASVLADLRSEPDVEVAALREAARSPIAPTSASSAVVGTASDPQSTPTRAQAIAAVAQAGPVSPVQDAPRAGEPGAAIVEHFDLPFSQDRVWALMSDPARVAACLPGAFLTGQSEDRVTGGVALRFGPMQAKFEGDAVLALDAEKRSARLQGRGRDRLTQSRAEGDIDWRVSAIDERASRVSIEMRYTLQGPFAQFSRGGLVQAFVRRIVQQFAANVAAALGTGGETGPASSTSQSEFAPQPGASPGLNPVALLIGIAWSRLRRLFGRRD
jgi:carbon-monoxide dehydrogenase small subunit